MNNGSSDSLGNLANFIIGPFGSTVTAEQYVDDSEYGYVRNKDIRDFRIKTAELASIPQEIYENLPKFHIKENDLLITVVGTLGKVAIARSTDTKSIFSCKSTIIRTKNINPFYLLTYLNTKIGHLFSLRGRRGVIQEGLNLPDLKDIQVFTPSNVFQEYIERIIKKSFSQSEKSEIEYQLAESTLLNELGLVNYQPSTENISVKSFSDSFGNSGRLDAEYYQPKYNDVISKITSSNYQKLSDIVTMTKSVEPGSNAYQEKGIPFVRVSNISKFEITEPDIHLSPTLFNTETLNKLQPKKDTILLSKDGTVGIAYKVKEDSKIITSGALLHLVIKDGVNVLPEYLTLVLNSQSVQMQADCDAGGSIIKHWKPSEVLELVIPIIDMAIQQTIEEKITKSFNLKAQSKHLLEVAKRAVEIAIEQNEQVALKYISNETEELIT